MREIELRKLSQKGEFELFSHFFPLVKLSIIRLGRIFIC